MRTEAFKRIFDNHPIVEFGLQNKFAFIDHHILEQFNKEITENE